MNDLITLTMHPQRQTWHGRVLPRLKMVWRGVCNTGHVQASRICFDHELAPIEARGQGGDVLFMHPHLLHGSSTNTTNRTRIAGNRCVWLDRPLPYLAPDAAGWTPVGLAIHQAVTAPSA